MRCVAVAAFGAVLAGSAMAGEMISGTNTYVTEERTWKTGQNSGYYMYDSTGTYKARSGFIPDSPVECHGAGFWTSEEIKGEGICIFGEGLNRWTVAFKMAPGEKFNAQTIEPYQRRGTWTVVRSTGKYAGMTGSGSFMASPTANNRKTTVLEGELEVAK